MLAGNEFQSLGRAIVKEDEYEEVRWDCIVSIVSWRERVFRLWWEERGYISVAGVPELCPAGVLLHASKSTDMSLSHLSTLKCHRPGPGSNSQPRTQKASAIPNTLPRPT
ncbi:hypothetical protein ANN_11984 [Periplaneta americana]|uniref:Uncharacterized protein n=1 Tax=Periplaneta americana TaxID=6978 RepID=A0ABQ8T7B6_PERAM|nr:hypothetical protein ANN_11984 [Periplaneta americana]